MTFKTALLGSAAAMFTVAGAQAADLKVAEPVDYVKVCDAFGTGYWYSPGTDWCLKLGGMVRFDVDFGNAVGGAGWGGGVTDDHRFQTEYELYFTAKRMTEYGPLTAYIELYGDTGAASAGVGPSSSDGTTVFNEGYVSLGPVLAGYTASILNQTGGTGSINGVNADSNTSEVDQIRLTFALSGWTFAVAAEDYRDRIGNSNTMTGLTGYAAGTNSTGEFPDLVVALTGKIGPKTTLHVGGGIGDRIDGTTWGAVADVTFDLSAWSAGSKLTFGGAYGNDGGEWIDLNSSTDGDYWSVYGALQYFWVPGKLSTTVAGSYWDTPLGVTGTSLLGNVTYVVTKGFSVAGEVFWADQNNTGSTTTGLVRLRADY